MTKSLAVAAAIFAVAVGVLVIILQGNTPDAAAAAAKSNASSVVPPIVEDDPVERYDVPVSASQPQRGRPNAPITIVEFADFQCPFCSTVLSSLREVEQIYGDKVRVVWRNHPLPIHGNAQLAAEAAQEAFVQGGDKAFWAMHDKLFAQRDALARGDLERYAGELGLNVGEFSKALDTHVHAAAVKGDSVLASLVGVRGTPGFFINGRPLSGAKPTVAFRELIDDELVRVQKLMAKGVAADSVYLTLTRNAKKLVQPRAKDATPSVAPTVYQVPVSERDPQQGPPDALVTLVMFGDFEDKFTRRAADTVNGLRTKYSNELRVVWKNLPLAFHDHAAKAATLSMEAFAQGGAELFWQTHALLLANQEALGDAELKRYGAELGLDARKLKAALATDKYRAQIEQTKALVPRLFPVNTTPLFTINGRFIRGAVAQTVFETTIEQELAKAKQMVAAGTAPKDVYQTIIRDGRTEDAALTPEQTAAIDKVYDVALPKDAPSKGPANAQVVIQEFADFQCPFCTRAEPVLEALLSEYKGKLRIVWRDYPLSIHPDAELSAQAAREIFSQGKSEKFWKYHALLFKNQGALSRADLEKYAQTVGGIDMAKFRSALDQGKHAARVKLDVDAYASTGKLATPGFLINGHLIEGAQPIEFFRALINRELAASK